MPNIIGVVVGDDDSDESRVFVNTDQITHWHHDKAGTTVIHFAGGTTLTVSECPWHILDKVETELEDFAV